MTKASVITVTFNSASELREFWGSFESSWAQWIVVDNASTDDSVAVAQELGATVITSASNLGFSRANNLGAQSAAGDVLIFCNPDVSVTGAGIDELARRAEHRRALVAPQLLNSDGSAQENGRGTPFPYRKLRHMLPGEPRRNRYLRFASSGQRFDVVWVMGAVVAASRATFDALGGWNEKFFIYYEDSDLCIRAAKLGIPTEIDGNVRWTHGWARETARSFSRTAWAYELRSALTFYRCHPYCVIPWGASARMLRRVDREIPPVPASERIN